MAKLPKSSAGVAPDKSIKSKGMKAPRPGAYELPKARELESSKYAQPMKKMK